MIPGIITQCCYAGLFMLSVTYAECHFQVFYADCRYAEFRNAECHLY